LDRKKKEGKETKTFQEIDVIGINKQQQQKAPKLSKERLEQFDQSRECL
jgi:hypothetical protein